jgi:two-component system, sensor histidine kinase and response regulator
VDSSVLSYLSVLSVPRGPATSHVPSTSLPSVVAQIHSLVAAHAHRPVALSIVIAICASYAALDLAGRTAASWGRVRLAWISGGASAMGLGIWSMQYIGMLALSLPIRVLYDLPTVVLSLIAAIFSSALALWLVSRDTLRMGPVVAASLVMGAGISAMHYIGMAAMCLPATCHFEPRIVAVPIVIAVIVSVVALLLVFRLRGTSREFSGMFITFYLHK